MRVSCTLIFTAAPVIGIVVEIIVFVIAVFIVFRLWIFVANKFVSDCSANHLQITIWLSL